MKEDKTLCLPERNIPILYETDVLVVGGGLAGVCAAVAARRTGASVTILERYGNLGGIAAGGLLGTFGGFYAYDHGKFVQIIKGLAGEILDRLRQHGAAGEPVFYKKTAIVPYDTPSLQRIFDDLVKEAGVSTLFHQLAVEVSIEERRVKRVVALGKGGWFGIACKIVIDASGDGDVATLAGIPALDDGGYPQFPSATFHLGGVDIDKAVKVSREELTEITEKVVREGIYDLPRVDGGIAPLPRPGEVRCNLTRLKIGDRPIDTLDVEELSFGEIDGRRQAFLYLDFLRNHVPGYERAYVNRLPAFVGIRESRRIKGSYILTEDDVLEARKFDDGIACSAWPIEQHGQGLMTRWDLLPDGEYHEIPLRSLVPEEIDNLFVAGRCISATHGAQAAVRIGACCMAMGEAVGVAAAMAIQQGIDIKKIDSRALREALRARGAFLPN